MNTFTVIKLDTKRKETWRYPARLLRRETHCLELEATFDREDTNFHGMPLQKGDRFIETYYTDRWYNVYEIHAWQDDQLRGWYCNISKPAEIQTNEIRYVDLALDLLVFPDGTQMILDEDEFEQLDITPRSRENALAALDDLQRRFATQFGK